MSKITLMCEDQHHIAGELDVGGWLSYDVADKDGSELLTAAGVSVRAQIVAKRHAPFRRYQRSQYRGFSMTLDEADDFIATLTKEVREMRRLVAKRSPRNRARKASP